MSDIENSTMHSLVQIKNDLDSNLSVVFSPNGEYLTSSSKENTIHLWRVSNCELIYTLTGHKSNVRSIAFSPNGDYLASGSGDCTICVWKVSIGELIKTITGHSSWVASVVFSPNGEYLASGS